MFPSLTPWAWVLAALAALCAGISKAGLPGMGTFTVMLMFQIIPGPQSTGAVLPLLITADLIAAAHFRQAIHWPQIQRLAWPILLGILLGCGVLLWLPHHAFPPTVGWLVLAMLVLQCWQLHRPSAIQPLTGSPTFAWAAGILTGASTMVANAAGPVSTIYLLMQGLPRREFVATMAWLFLIVNLIKVPFSLSLHLITLPSLGFNLVLLPAVALGLYLGIKIIHHIPPRAFQATILTLCALAALRMVSGWP